MLYLGQLSRKQSAQHLDQPKWNLVQFFWFFSNIWDCGMKRKLISIFLIILFEFYRCDVCWMWDICESMTMTNIILLTQIRYGKLQQTYCFIHPNGLADLTEIWNLHLWCDCYSNMNKKSFQKTCTIMLTIALSTGFPGPGTGLQIFSWDAVDPLTLENLQLWDHWENFGGPSWTP